MWGCARKAGAWRPRDQPSAAAVRPCQAVTAVSPPSGLPAVRSARARLMRGPDAATAGRAGRPQSFQCHPCQVWSMTLCLLEWTRTWVPGQEREGLDRRRSGGGSAVQPSRPKCLLSSHGCPSLPSAPLPEACALASSILLPEVGISGFADDVLG